MNKQSGFVSLAVLGVFILVVLGGAFYITYEPGEETPSEKIAGAPPPATDSAQTQEGKTQDQNYKNPFDTQARDGWNPDASQSTKPSDEAAKLKIELEYALKSGGISPTRHESMTRQLDDLARRGLDTATLSTLRSMLAKIETGGTKPAPPPPPPQAKELQQPPQETRPYWEYDPSKTSAWYYWAREGTPPACPDPLVLPAPVDLNLVTAILYPGQVRGDGPKDFKPHGGFILKPEGKKVDLRAPMDGYLTSVAKFTDEFGLHYGLTFQHPCGIQFGGGHFGVLPPDIQAVVDKIPLKAYGDSRNEQVIPPYFVKKGQVVVTGLQEKAHPERPGFDWGVSDLRQTNQASQDPQFRELYGYAPWNTYYGVCWFDLLPQEEETRVRSFPGGDGKEGKNSEYCK